MAAHRFPQTFEFLRRQLGNLLHNLLALADGEFIKTWQAGTLGVLIIGVGEDAMVITGLFPGSGSETSWTNFSGFVVLTHGWCCSLFPDVAGPPASGPYMAIACVNAGVLR